MPDELTPLLEQLQAQPSCPVLVPRSPGATRASVSPLWKWVMGSRGGPGGPQEQQHPVGGGLGWSQGSRPLWPCSGRRARLFLPLHAVITAPLVLEESHLRN